MSGEQTTNTLLGYPDDARLLIINADDFGMCHSNNTAIMSALREGVVQSTSLMTPCPWAPQGMRLLKENPDIPFGVHLTIISEMEEYRWGPLSSKNRVPSLIDEAGYFFSNDRAQEVMARANLDEVDTEFRAQINSVLGAGLRPTHLDWHCLGDGGRIDIFELTRGLAIEHGLALRVFDQTYARQCLQDGLPANDHGLLDSFSMAIEGKAAALAQMLRNLPVGLSEWALHPSLGNAESQAMEPDTWGVRRADFDFAMSREARDVVAQEGIILLDYRASQKVWAGRA